MLKKKIHGTDLEVSQLCFGTMIFGTPVGEQQARELVDHAISKGINFFDTANIYEGYTRFAGSPGGISEVILGKALKGAKDVVVATKVGMKVGNAPEDEFTSRKAIMKQLDKSLLRLQREIIDIYYLHKPDPVTPLEEILGAIQDVQKAGKIKCFGISNYSAQQIKDMIKTGIREHLPLPSVCQPPLNLLNQDSLKDIIPLCAEHDIAVVPYTVFQGGILTGKYSRNDPVPENSRKAEKSEWVEDLDDDLLDKLDKINRQASAAGMSMLKYALRWVLDRGEITSAIVGFKRAIQIDEAVSALQDD
jgi:aryl-alcohol dehydrogenase-like predicted oxidoreductase